MILLGDQARTAVNVARRPKPDEAKSRIADDFIQLVRDLERLEQTSPGQVREARTLTTRMIHRLLRLDQYFATLELPTIDIKENLASSGPP